jgi:cytosine/adenosine deaminase-related metal-dependent hydrolase
MARRKFRASELFDGEKLQQQKVLITDEEGTIEAVVDVEEAGEDVEEVEGILTPGLVNAHCHLELSHLKQVISPHTGLIEFLCSVVTKRNFSEEVIQQAIVRAEAEMYLNGIVAVGDIGNTSDTAGVKSSSKLYWQNFVEVLSFRDDQAMQQMNHYGQVAQTMRQSSLEAGDRIRTSIVPHAPYTISPQTFQLLNKATTGQVISMHHQEHPAENELYEKGGGDYLRLFGIFGMQSSPFPVTGMNSTRSVLPYFDQGQTILLIHNTYMKEEDVQWVGELAKKNGIQIVYGLCPNANIYIENNLPPVQMLLENDAFLVLGTDSYSSNWQLSIASEMKVLSEKSGVPRQQLLKMATFNGAKALGFSDRLGSFEKGKKPGLVQLAADFSWSKRLL